MNKELNVSNLSARAEATTRRTYNRPIGDGGLKFETWSQTVQRSHFEHHRKLWIDAANGDESVVDYQELHELLLLGLNRSGLVSGRTLWLGGTEYAYSRAASQFNCSGLRLDTVYDIVDSFWLLLNGCGVGGKPKSGTLRGYQHQIPNLVIVPSTQSADFRGPGNNTETMPTEENGATWTIRVGDSAVSWAKIVGKMLVAPKTRIDKLVLDFSLIRGPGGRLKGYGWICNGYKPFAEALSSIHHILNRNAGNLLSEEDIADIFNWCGTVLSSRRAAEALLMDSHHPSSDEFGTRKREYWVNNPQRRQSNNSLMFWSRPSLSTIENLLEMNLDGGEPGFVNATAAIQRCPWFEVFNPCFEICLPSHGFCNLVSLSLPSFGRNFRSLERAVWIMARANYRQTCVKLVDEILQPRWDQTNDTLRLCGVSFTGVIQAGWLTDYQIRRLRNAAVAGAYSMADQLGLPFPKAITTIKPEGTRSKISGTTEREIAEGMHGPLGRFIFNWINFAHSDPLVDALASSGYLTMPNPSDASNILVRFPVDYRGCPFTKVGGKEVNIESGVSQLNRYKRWNNLWADHNVSATISIDRDEIKEVANWIYQNWDNGYVATAFLQRADPTKTAQDLGHPYLPQEVVTEDAYNAAISKLTPVDWDRFHHGLHEVEEEGCVGGVCPVK